MTASILAGKVAGRALALPIPTDESDRVDLSGEFLLGSTAPALRAAAIAAIERHLCDHYTRRPGIAPLCRSVAQSLAGQGISIGEDGVVISGSVQEARYVAVRALTAGKTVYQPLPAPTDYAAALAFAGAAVIPFDPAGDYPAANGGVLLITNPNPITGQVYAEATLAQLARWAAAANLAVIADESGAMLHPSAALVHFAALPEMAARTLTIGSFLGVPGLQGWQVSWFAGAKAVMTPVRDLKQSITICTAAASQYAALAVGNVEDSGDVIAQAAERQEAITGLLDHHGIPYLPPDTPAYVVADVRALGGSDIVAAACAAAGVIVGNGNQLGNPGTVRIGTPAADLGGALERLDAALIQLKGR